MGFSEQAVASYIAFVGILSVLAQVSRQPYYIKSRSSGATLSPTL